MGAHSASTLALSRCADAHSPFLCRLKRAASAAQVGQPDHESEPTWDAALAQRGGDEEEELEEEARQDEDPQLPLLPPLHRA